MIQDLTEDLYFEMSIEKIFINYQEKRIAIYGVAHRTELFLEYCPNHNVIGLMDEKRTGQYFYGKKVLSFDEILRAEVEIIIILAAEDSTQIIYSRLYDLCKNNKILILNRFGKKLMPIYGQAYKAGSEDAYYSISSKNLEESIQKNDIIYFGIWNSLIMTRCLKQEDFSEIEDNEKRLKTIVPRKRITDYCIKAVNSGKKVILIQDTPMSLEEVEIILKREKINGYIDILTIDAINLIERGLYIGNHIEKSEIFSEYYEIKSAVEMLKISSYREILEEIDNRNERSLVGLFCAYAFNDPFILHNSNGKRIIENVYDLGYLFLGPLAVCFAIWLIKIVKEENYEAILFCARDGFLFQKLYDYCVEKMNVKCKTKSIYFKTSRKLCINTGMQDAKEVEGTAQHPYSYSPDFMLQNKYNIAPQDIEIYNSDKFKNPIFYVLAHKDYIFQASKELRKQYLKYMKEIGIEEQKKYLFFDLCSCGTSQHFLNNFVPFNLEAIYLCFYRSNENMRMNWKEELNFRSYFENGYYFDYTSNVFLDYCFLETFATSFDPTIVGLNADGEFLYGKEDRSEEELKYISEMQKAIFDFAKDYIDIFIAEDEEINKIIPDRLFSFKKMAYTNERCKELNNMKLSDEWVKNRTPVVRK